MNRLMVLATLAMLSSGQSAEAATLIDFDFSEIANNVEHDKEEMEVRATNVLDPRIQIVQGMNVFSPSALNFSIGLANTPPTTSMNLFGWASPQATSTREQAFDGNHYVSYTIAPQESWALNLNGAMIEFDIERNGTGGPQHFAMYLSTNSNFHATDNLIGEFSIVQGSDGHYDLQNFAVTLPNSGFENITGPVEVRLYGYGATGVGNLHLIGARISNAELMAVPEPGSQALGLVGAGVVALSLARFRRRRRRCDG